jgi:putative protease
LANAVNWATVKFWKQMGLTRVILSRELSLDEIEEIRTQVPDMELEIFVHGALCMAYSGRCLLSGGITISCSSRNSVVSAICTNICRRNSSSSLLTLLLPGCVLETDKNPRA